MYFQDTKKINTKERFSKPDNDPLPIETTEVQTYCYKNTYQGATECDDPDEIKPFNSGDIDAKNAVLSLGRNDYVRAITGVIDRKNEMGKYLAEEIQDAENERWNENY